MADVRLLQQPGAPNILGAVQTGVNIAQARERQRLLLQQAEAGRQQLALENQRKDEEIRQRGLERDFTRGGHLFTIGAKTKNVDMQNKGIMTQLTSLNDGQPLPQEFKVTQKVFDLFSQHAAEKDPAKQEVLEDLISEEVELSIAELKPRLAERGLIDVSQEQAIAKEQRIQEGKIALEEKKAALKPPPTVKPQFKMFKRGKDFQFIDITKDIPKGFKPFVKPGAPGKPFKQGQMFLYKDTGAGNPPEVKVLKSIDGNVNVPKFEEAIAEGFQTESMIRRQQPDFADKIIEGLGGGSKVSMQDRVLQDGINTGRTERFDEIKALNPNATDDQINQLIDLEGK
jgi:hypothetical protein